jgi:hypothetical protein
MKSTEQVHERHKLALRSGYTPRETGSCKPWKGLRAPLVRESVCKVVGGKRLHGLHSVYHMTLKGISSFWAGDGRGEKLTNHARDKA